MAVKGKNWVAGPFGEVMGLVAAVKVHLPEVHNVSAVAPQRPYREGAKESRSPNGLRRSK